MNPTTESPHWRRVTRAEPCPVCKKPDWCAIGTNFINCMRVAAAKLCANGGWLHPTGTEPKPIPKREDAPPGIDADALHRRWIMRTERRHLEDLARLLEVDELPLRLLGVAWANEHDAWAFPMSDATGRVTGIRLRNAQGDKWAVKGGKNGLFVPDVTPLTRCFICEGPTDTAALLAIGLYAIGRPSCNEGALIYQKLLPRLGVRSVVIVGDHDDMKERPDGSTYNPGVDGANRLSELLPMPNCIWLPPTKDVREFVRIGGTAQQLESLIRPLKWRQPKESHE